MIQKWWKPKQVAEALGIGERSARELMSSGAIKSQCYATTGNGRQYFRTTESAVYEYQEKFSLTPSRSMRPTREKSKAAAPQLEPSSHRGYIRM